MSASSRAFSPAVLPLASSMIAATLLLAALSSDEQCFSTCGGRKEVVGGGAAHGAAAAGLQIAAGMDARGMMGRFQALGEPWRSPPPRRAPPRQPLHGRQLSVPLHPVTPPRCSPQRRPARSASASAANNEKRQGREELRWKPLARIRSFSSFRAFSFGRMVAVNSATTASASAAWSRSCAPICSSSICGAGCLSAAAGGAKRVSWHRYASFRPCPHHRGGAPLAGEFAGWPWSETSSKLRLTRTLSF